MLQVLTLTPVLPWNATGADINHPTPLSCPGMLQVQTLTPVLPSNATGDDTKSRIALECNGAEMIPRTALECYKCRHYPLPPEYYR